jgi:hypothetical protein
MGALGLLALCLGLVRCGDPDDTGSLLLPGREISFSDTTTISLNNNPVDTLVTAARTFIMIGQARDPQFGTLTADAYTTVGPVERSD